MFKKQGHPRMVEEPPRKVVFSAVKIHPEPPPLKTRYFPEETIKKIMVLEEFFHNKTLNLDATN